MTSKLFLETLNFHYEKEKPFVVYSKPDSSIVRALLQNNTEVYHTKDYTESGFVFAPFNTQEKSIIIPNSKSNLIETEAIVLEDFAFGEVENNNIEKQVKNKYLELVEKTISEIKSATLDKVVISREEKVVSKEKNIITLFLRLLKIYNNVFVYCFCHPKIGIWLGATPETFVSIQGSHFKTMSLAGTKKVSPYNKWRDKEFNEQKLVTNFITQEIELLINNIKVSEVETIQAGTLQHLKTTISGLLNYEEYDLKKILSKLHPTPAVCGFPKATSKAFILKNEGYNREYYTGFLGELNIKQLKCRNSNKRNTENNAYMNIKNTTYLYVNLRCMQLKGNEATIYIGGGITKDSIAEEEWEETINKSYTIKKILF